VAPASASSIARAAGADLAGAIHRRLVAGEHYLPAAIVVRDIADKAGLMGGDPGDFGRQIPFGTEESGHRALPYWHRGLHRIPADAQQPRRLCDRQAAGSAERGIFA
jgi:hypothetical protein